MSDGDHLSEKKNDGEKEQETWQIRAQGRAEERMTCSQNVDLPLPGAPTIITRICFDFFSSSLKSSKQRRHLKRY